MDKDVIERCCRAAGLVPEKRTVVDQRDLFIADGFVPADKTADYFWRFGITPKDFPMGMWATIWWLAEGEDKVDMGQPLFFEAFHNPELGGAATRKMARINTAVRECKGFVEQRKKVRANG